MNTLPVPIKQREAAFLYPVIDGELYLGERGTPPQIRRFGPVGGKQDLLSTHSNWQVPSYIRAPGGYKKRVADRFAEQEGKEYPGHTAVREFAEEAFSTLRFPHDFQPGDITDVFTLGAVGDYLGAEPSDNWCHMVIANVHRTDFSLSPRELKSLRPIRELADEQIYPLAKPALMHLVWLQEMDYLRFDSYAAFQHLNFKEQIPKLALKTLPFTGLVGARMYHDLDGAFHK